MRDIAVFASGAGTNAENIINYFSGSKEVNVALVLTNNPKAGIIDRCKRLNIECRVFNRDEFSKSDTIVNILTDMNIEYIVLAGFLWLVPNNMIEKWSGRIVNIHPALLPAYGGKGMHGDNVHKAIVEAGERISGITIHLIDELYDNGSVLFQATVEVLPTDTYKSLAEKISKLEQIHFPVVIEQHIKNSGKLLRCRIWRMLGKKGKN